MNQRTALLISAALTAFVLVLVGAVVANVSSHSADAAAQSNNQASAAQTRDLPAPGDGRIQESEARRPAQQPTPTASAVAITPDQAATAALSAVPRATLTRQPELVSFDGITAYEVLLDRGNVYVDARTGQVLYSTVRSARSGDGRSRLERGGNERHEAHEEDDDD